MNIRVETVPVISMDELECELDLDRSQFQFYERDDYKEGYLWFNTDEDAILDLKQDLADYLDMIQERGEMWRIDHYEERLNNDIMLVEKLRDMGLDDGVLIYIWD